MAAGRDRGKQAVNRRQTGSRQQGLIEYAEHAGILSQPLSGLIGRRRQHGEQMRDAKPRIVNPRPALPRAPMNPPTMKVKEAMCSIATRFAKVSILTASRMQAYWHE